MKRSLSIAAILLTAGLFPLGCSSALGQPVASDRASNQAAASPGIARFMKIRTPASPSTQPK